MIENKNCYNNNCHDCKPHCDESDLSCLCNILKKLYKDPSYGTFWQTNFVTVPLNQAFPFNETGATTPDITLVNPTTIKVALSGVYNISYRVAISVATNSNPNNFVDQRVSLYINGVKQPNAQASFGIYAPDINSCVPIAGEAIVFIPANALLTIVNDGQFIGSSDITTCDNGVNAATFNIIRIG